ncbi:DUF1450 domain-containing protein [Effusibacillus dendaii]|uniref:DUF1450 domain-containing protein n=1 Tax=Effusibacillus dendaii TaxID=2743772 RepID=A0A7I8DF66_9BACL|nr:DUF1450 domain-containing protein [Effusibacillus dendaii]BCJ87200.1 hypothetical protein skT53_21850 [Effusibacillus dendaii]
MAISKLDYCLNNLQTCGTSHLYNTVEKEFPHIEQRRWGCLSNCSECMKKPFVLINDSEILAGEDPNDLLAQLRAKMTTPA